MNEPYRYRVHGAPNPEGLITVWSFEQESKPGRIIVWDDPGEMRGIQAGDTFRVTSLKVVPGDLDWGIPKSEMFVEFVGPADCLNFLAKRKA
jgi:hypothetical protein